MVVDGRVATTTGITAAMPAMLTLIEAIAGRDRAQTVAEDLGLSTWDTRHTSEAFRLTRPFALTVLGNALAFWNREQLGIELTSGVDEVSLALVADAWSRTYRSRVLTLASSAAPLTTRGGVRVIPDVVEGSWPARRRLPPLEGTPPADIIVETLDAIGARYGAPTSEVVAMQLEYPGTGR